MILSSPAARGLFQAIVENPFDDVPRLLLADVLEESGEGERAEFVRVQVELAKLLAGPPLLPVPTIARKERIDALRHRERELLGENVSVTPNTVWPRYCQWCERDGIDPRWVYVPGFGLPADDLAGNHFRRGFVASVTLSLADWCGEACSVCHGSGNRGGNIRGCVRCRNTGRRGGHGPALVQAAPLEQVTLLEWRGESCRQCATGVVPTDREDNTCEICGGLYNSRAALCWARQEAGLPALTQRR